MNSPSKIDKLTGEALAEYERRWAKHLNNVAIAHGMIHPPEPPTPLQTQVGGAHYKDFAIQPVEFCQRNELNYCESACVKYVSRHRAKNGRQDIEKAIHYLQLLLEIEYPLTEPSTEGQ